MAEVKQVSPRSENEIVIERAKDFWARFGNQIMIACVAIIVVCGGYLAYKYLIVEPKEQKASEAIFKAQDYFQRDSLQLALNGDGLNPGFEKIISQYGGTKSGNLARFYAGSIYLKLGNFTKAASYLKDFSSSSKQIQARAYKLLGDAYAEQGKNNDALDSYKKAAHEYEDDDAGSSEYLFTAGYFADRVMNDKKEATEIFKELKNKYPQSNATNEADKLLAQEGVYSAD